MPLLLKGQNCQYCINTDARFKIQDARYRIENIGYRMQKIQYRLKNFLFFITLSLLLSCSTEKPADVTPQMSSDAENSAIHETIKPHVSTTMDSYSLEIKPLDAAINSTLNLRAKGFNISDAKIEWLVNGDAAANPAPDQFKTTNLKKGDAVQARATIEDKEISSNTITIKNTPPEFTKIKIMPESFKLGDKLYVDVAGNDIDGDAVIILYEWTKNGEPAGNDQKIAPEIKRGDKISVKITLFDGEAYGRPATLNREIKNMPPMIVGDKNFNFDGRIYTYQVKATDPDGDNLTYSLKSSPKDMTINPATGLIHWDVPADFKGEASITVSVTDGHGGEAIAPFTAKISFAPPPAGK